MPPVRTSSRRPRAVAGPGGHFLDDHPDLDADRGGQGPPPPASGPAEGAVAVPGPAPGHPTREAPEVTVPIWRLTPKQRAALLRIVEAGGRAQRRGIPSEQLRGGPARRRQGRRHRRAGAPPAPAQLLTAKNLTSLIEVRWGPEEG